MIPLSALQKTPYKKSLKRDFTASVLIVDEESLLLLYHRKLNSWLPPGGHVEEGELPHEAALREAKEETGLDVELLVDDPMWFKGLNGESLPRPFICLLEEIPQHKETLPHQHIDFIFLGRPAFKQAISSTEGHEMRWFTFNEVEALSEGTVFPEIKQLAKILSKKLSNL